MIKKVGGLMETCMFCEQKSKEGLKICSTYICGSCETELIFTHVEDPFYLLFVDKMKSLFGPISNS